MTAKRAAEAKLNAKIAARRTADLIVLIDTMESMPTTTEAIIVRAAIFTELEGRMTDSQRERYEAMFDDDHVEQFLRITDTELLLLAFDDVARAAV